jgi:hypothetical protein
MKRYLSCFYLHILTKHVGLIIQCCKQDPDFSRLNTEPD